MIKYSLPIIAVTLIWVAIAAFANETTKNADSSSDSSSKSDIEKNAGQLAAVLAIEADKEYGAYLGGECLTCHIPDGGDGSIPQIHAKTKDYLASALLEYKNQQRENEVMQGVTAALGNEEIAALATFFSEQ